jgi:RNA polymerase sigma factor (TIGR02999 family)
MPELPDSSPVTASVAEAGDAAVTASSRGIAPLVPTIDAEPDGALDAESGAAAESLERLFAVAYPELRVLARRHLRKEREGITLDSGALVHEAWLRLASSGSATAGAASMTQAHFFGIAAHVMRQVLVDHARARRAEKRGGGVIPRSLDDALEVAQPARPERLIALDEALTRLARLDPEAARVVECRYFAGLTLEETAHATGLSVTTARRRWDAARAWLARAMSPDDDAPSTDARARGSHDDDRTRHT